MNDIVISRKQTTEALTAYAETITDDFYDKNTAFSIRMGIKMAADFIKDSDNVPAADNVDNRKLRRCRGIATVYKNGRWQTEDFELGYFHQWGINYEEIGEKPGNYSVAIVELPDGRVVMPTADNITFLN